MPEKILLTGGSGRLGSELRQRLPSLIAPPSTDLDITDPASVERNLQTHTPDLIIHAAAYTDVAGAETDQQTCWRVNVAGTRNLVRATVQHDLPFIHISTDYVFYGDRGDYKEDDPLGPVRNIYALSKLVAEELVRLVPEHLVIRTSFRPKQWEYPVAFDDIYTSQDYVDIVAPDIALAIEHFRDIPFDTLHIATERKSVFELAQRRKPEVERGSKRAAAVDLPDDISLNVSRWRVLKEKLQERRLEPS